MDTNIIYNIDCVAGMNQMIDEESIDLIIADPPYFKVIGEKWDYLWRTEEDYLEWSEKWIAEAARVLRMGGSFYLFGYFRMLSRLLPILENSSLFRIAINHFESSFLLMLVEPHTAHSVSKLETTAPQALQDPN